MRTVRTWATAVQPGGAVLGAEAYQRLLETVGLMLIDETNDEGENYYYLARKP
ncbi:MAG TPA: hypothetical protein VFW98_04890 [Gemmatimonadaceae bacterium]|nr:hypothetical protein [Gemmatimonadaceae bacterium]